MLFLLLYGVTFDEWDNQHYLLMTKYDNGEIESDEVLKVMQKEKEDFKNANKNK